MALNVINFSNGIRPEELQENFEILQDQISRERIGVGGAGIAYGLDVSFLITDIDFKITVASGTVIDNQGNEVFINEKTLDIEPPILNSFVEFLSVSDDKKINLKHIPYALNRRCPAEHLNSFEPEFSGITLKYRNSLNEDDYIRTRDIHNKTLTIAGCESTEVQVFYNYTGNRIDTLYLDNNYNIKLTQGTTSSTPSAIIPADAKLLLAYIEVDCDYRDSDRNTPHATMYIKDDLRSIRNLYTDSKGGLYICGVPFDDLQIIHIEEPINPKENTFWFNPINNTLYRWGAIDDYVYKNEIHVSADYYKNFEGDLIFSTDMDYKMGTGELVVYLNGTPLVRGRDYEEMTDAIVTESGNTAIGLQGNLIRILGTLVRPDAELVDEDILLKEDDLIIYTITYIDGECMWLPVNKSTFTVKKEKKIFCTYYEGIENNPKYLYDTENGNKCAYFDSPLANSFDEGRDREEADFYPYKYQYFLFDRIKDSKLLFTPGTNELTVIINQMILHDDQFIEITIDDLLPDRDLLPQEIKDVAIKNFGWTDEYIKNNYLIDKSYDNSGIGFMLVDPLDAGIDAEFGHNYADYKGSNNLFVEAIIERRVSVGALKTKLERSASFIFEDRLDEEDMKDGVVTLRNCKYGFAEHQLEVFVDGIKQTLGKDYIEEFGFLRPIYDSKNDEERYEYELPIEYELTEEDGNYPSFFYRNRGRVCNKFKFKKNVAWSSVTYRTTTNIYTYDHINNYMDRLVNKTDNYEESFNDYKITVDTKINKIMNYVEEQFTNTPSYGGGGSGSNSDIIDLSRIPMVLVNNSIKSLEHINISMQYVDTDEYLFSDIRPNDFLVVVHRRIINVNGTNLEFDKFLVNGVDYTIGYNNNGKGILNFSNNEDRTRFASGDTMIITGLKIDSTDREIK